MAKKPKTPPVMDEKWSIGLVMRLNSTKLLEFRILRLIREKDPAKRKEEGARALEIVEQLRRAPQDAKWEKTRTRRVNILAVEAELRKSGKTSREAFDALWRERFKDAPPKASTRQRARRWDREGRPDFR